MSTQNTETPNEFIGAVERMLRINFLYDLAASSENAKCERFYDESMDALKIVWPTDGWCFLNPPFNDLTPWVEKCVEQVERGVRIVSIWPLSSDFNMVPAWQYADVIIVHGRIWPLVRGCMLCVWSDNRRGDVTCVKWDRKAGTLRQVWRAQ
jgi:phage N-6-adenine-methyltransferase